MVGSVDTTGETFTVDPLSVLAPTTVEPDEDEDGDEDGEDSESEETEPVEEPA